MADDTIDQITAQSGPHYEPFGWHQWPEHPWMSYQFRGALGETQAGSGTVSECFQAASRMVPGDFESWHKEFLRIADKNSERAARAEEQGKIATARAAWLRASSYYRSAEFWLDAEDPRRLQTFTKCEDAFASAGRYFSPVVEKVEIPYENGDVLYGYFLRAPKPQEGKQPVLIAFGGIDSFKEELYAMVGKGTLERGISCLFVDGPGQGGTLRREKLVSRPDYQVPVAACVDYLETRTDVDLDRIALVGSSLGGFYAAQAGSHEHRLAGVISHGAIWNVYDHWVDKDDSFGLADHIKWVMGVDSMVEAIEKAKQYTLEGQLEKMTCPYLIVHGGHDVLGVAQAQQVAEYARSHGVDVTLRLVTEDETGAEHCQHDNPTLGMELIGDWLSSLFLIDERALLPK